MQINRFNIRVYALIIDEQNRILVSNETYRGKNMIKFPGGGLEFGEGILNCLQRELAEELNVNSTAHQLYYVNETFQESAFSMKDQIISIYYQIRKQDLNKALPESEFRMNDIDFKWLEINRELDQHLTMPIDIIVSRKLSITQ